MTILIRRNKNSEPIGLLAELFEPEPVLPAAWNGPHVAMRIVEGFETLRAMQLRDYSTKARTAWVPYLYEFDDLVEQAKQYELEITQAKQNRTRVSPSAEQITRMDQALYWPLKYLSALNPDLCEAVNAVALAYSLGLDSGWVAHRRGGYADTWRMRHDEGCEVIAIGLIRDRVAVF
jgi:hypothetical protein